MPVVLPLSLNTQQLLQHVVLGLGQWYISKNEVDRGFDNYLSISGGGGNTIMDSPVPIQTKRDLCFEATKELLITASNLKRAAKALDKLTRLFINSGTFWNETIAKSCQLKNINGPLLSCAAESLNGISNSLPPIPSVKYLYDRIESNRVREVVDDGWKK